MRLNITYTDGTSEELNVTLGARLACEKAGWSVARIQAEPTGYSVAIVNALKGRAPDDLSWTDDVIDMTPVEEADPTSAP